MHHDVSVVFQINEDISLNFMLNFQTDLRLQPELLSKQNVLTFI